MIDPRDKIYSMCTAIYEGQEFDFLNYDQYVKNPKILKQVIREKDRINALYKALKASPLDKIQRTASGAIQKHNIKHASGAWDCKEVRTAQNVFKGVVITVILRNRVFVFKCGAFGVKDSEITGRKAFRMFESACKKHGINIWDYAIDNGVEIKSQIERPYILCLQKFKRLEHVHHLDINNAWCAGVCEDYPELIPVFVDLREKNKLIGDIALGFCQSEYIQYKLSNLSKSGINNTNRNITDLMESLAKQNFDVIAINTDGIWYKDKTNQNRIYTDENEGKELGQWKTDHKDCTFCAYSNGQYYFIENGKFNVRARGYYLYEKKKPRTEWDEHDFDQAMASAITLTWDNEEGFITYEAQY